MLEPVASVASGTRWLGRHVCPSPTALNVADDSAGQTAVSSRTKGGGGVEVSPWPTWSTAWSALYSWPHPLPTRLKAALESAL